MAGLVIADGELPPLRQDLALHAGPPAPDGSPTWTLHDPAANRFYQLSWPAFELLSRWSLGRAEDVLAATGRETPLQLSHDELNALRHMLLQCNLCRAAGPADTQRLAQQARLGQAGVARWLLQNYLFFRVPLWHPTDFLNRWAVAVRWAFHPAFWCGIAATALLGLVLAGRRWDVFMHTATSYANGGGALAIALALGLGKLLHEMGHAFAAQRAGCRVPTMGVAVVVLWPVLYTDTAEAWKLTSRHQRLVIGAAGMLAEIALGAVALLAWSLLPDTPAWQPARSGAFLLATTTWVLTLAVNASPFMRFDGYFLLSDALNVPNLHERAFALGRWWLRERLFGLGDAPPERHAPQRQRFLVAFAFGTWLYRLSLFLGIAWLVYHLFFRALGLALMAVELGWFIVRPVVREGRVWWMRRAELHWNRVSLRSALLLAGALGWLLWPWSEGVHAPAMLEALQAQAVYAPHAAQLRAPLPARGTVVHAGDLLVQLQAPELQSQLALARVREEQLQWQLQQQPFDEQLLRAGPLLRRQWEAAQAEVAGARSELERLQVRAPFDATVVEAADDAEPGAWIGNGERLLQLTGLQGAKVEAFVDEAALRDVADVHDAVFIADAPERTAITCHAVQADAVQVAQIDHEALASPYGGPIAAQRGSDGALVPRVPLFRIRLGQCDAAGVPAQEASGVAHLAGPRRSWASQAWRWLVKKGWAELERS